MNLKILMKFENTVSKHHSFVKTIEYNGITEFNYYKDVILKTYEFYRISYRFTCLFHVIFYLVNLWNIYVL